MAERKGLLDRLGDLDGFFPTGQPLAKGAQFGQAPVKIGPTEHEGQARLAEALVAPRALERLDVAPVVLGRLLIMAQGEVGETQEERRHHLQRKIPAGRGDGEGALAGLNGVILVAVLEK